METIINLTEIQEFFDENKEDLGLASADFEDFLAYLEIDFYDFLRSNLKNFSLKKEDNTEI